MSLRLYGKIRSKLTLKLDQKLGAIIIEPQRRLKTIAVIKS